MNLLNINNVELKLILENTDSSDLINYIKTLDGKNKKLLLNNIEIIFGKNYVNNINFILANTMKKNNIFIVIVTFVMLSFDFIIFSINEKMTYLEMVNKEFFLIAYLYPFLIIFDSFWIGLFIIIGIIIPIILINKKRKLYPYIIIYIIFLGVHLFIGYIMFLIKDAFH